MAKLRLDGTSKAPSPYSEFTKNYRMSGMIEDRRDVTKSERPSSTPRGIAGSASSTVRSANQAPSTPDANTPDDFSTDDFGRKGGSPTTPGSGFPSVTSNQQKANYAPQMEEYINNSQKK